MRILLILGFVAICSISFAQQKPQLKLYVPNSDDISALERLGKLNQGAKPVEGFLYPKELKSLNGLNSENEAKYLGSNELGELYALPNSGMPWLKPNDINDEQNKLPVIKFTEPSTLSPKAGEIPNPIKRKKPLLQQ
jgi:hypothetical protein